MGLAPWAPGREREQKEPVEENGEVLESGNEPRQFRHPPWRERETHRGRKMDEKPMTD